MDRIATTFIDLLVTVHALARFELAHSGYPFVKSVIELSPDLVPSYLARVPMKDPWDRPYRYEPHDVLLRRHPKASAPLTDSYELSARIPSPRTGEILTIRLFNGTFVETATELVSPLLTLRSYPKYSGSVVNGKQAMKMFGLARPLELAKLAALRAVEDTADAALLPELRSFLKFNEPPKLQEIARGIIARYVPR